ncbi:MAG: hypothetical protein AB1689_06015 [Thermodesulfobacteriota bacterium]
MNCNRELRTRDFARGAALLAMLAASTSGCAFGTRNVDLTYPDAIARAQVTSQPKGTIAVSRFKDARTDEYATGQQVGQVRNGYGMPTASVDAIQDPVLWVTDGLARGLMLHGYKVEKVESPQSAGSLLVVDGSVVRIFADSYVTINAEIVADVSLIRDGAAVWNGQCQASAGKVNWVGGADEFHAVLVDAVEQFATECVGQIVGAIERATAT